MVPIEQGVKVDGIAVSMAQLCRCFEVPRRSVYYGPTKARVKVTAELFEPIKTNGRILAAGGAIVGDDEVSFDSVAVRLDNDHMFVDGFE